MAAGDADSVAEMPDSHPEGSGRNPRDSGMGASNVTAKAPIPVCFMNRRDTLSTSAGVGGRGL